MSDVETAVDGAQVAPAEVEQAKVPESTTEQVETPQWEEKPRDEKGRFVPQERVNEITRARREAERRAEALERELASYRQQSAQPKPQQHEKAPALADFQSAEEWGAALVEFATNKALSTTEQKFSQQDQQRHFDGVMQSFAEKERAFSATTPDYMDRVAELAGAVPFSQPVLEALAASDHGPAIAYHLANHLDEADRIARLPPHLAAVQLGRIEAQVSAPKPKPVSKAPNPVPTVGGGTAQTKDPDRMTTEEWVAWRRSQLS